MVCKGSAGLMHFQVDYAWDEALLKVMKNLSGYASDESPDKGVKETNNVQSLSHKKDTRVTNLYAGENQTSPNTSI